MKTRKKHQPREILFSTLSLLITAVSICSFSLCFHNSVLSFFFCFFDIYKKDSFPPFMFPSIRRKKLYIQCPEERESDTVASL